MSVKLLHDGKIVSQPDPGGNLDTDYAHVSGSCRAFSLDRVKVFMLSHKGASLLKPINRGKSTFVKMSDYTDAAHALAAVVTALASPWPELEQRRISLRKRKKALPSPAMYYHPALCHYIWSMRFIDDLDGWTKTYRNLDLSADRTEVIKKILEAAKQDYIRSVPYSNGGWQTLPLGGWDVPEKFAEKRSPFSSLPLWHEPKEPVALKESTLLKWMLLGNNFGDDIEANWRLSVPVATHGRCTGTSGWWNLYLYYTNSEYKEFADAENS